MRFLNITEKLKSLELGDNIIPFSERHVSYKSRGNVHSCLHTAFRFGIHSISVYHYAYIERPGARLLGRVLIENYTAEDCLIELDKMVSLENSSNDNTINFDPFNDPRTARLLFNRYKSLVVSSEPLRGQSLANAILIEFFEDHLMFTD